jgi:phosphate transport system permease protein
MLAVMEASSVPGLQKPLESRRRVVDRFGDTVFGGLTGAAALGSVGLIGLLIYKVVDGAWPSIDKFGIAFVWHETWDVGKDTYGALPLIWGTLYTSVVALLIAGPISIAIGLYLAELAPRAIRGLVGSLIEMLAAIPSVVLGLWGILVLGPIVQNTLGGPIHSGLGWLPFFGSKPTTAGVFSAVLVLTIMITPITASISRELFRQVPSDIKEGAIGLGLTRWEMMKGVMLPYTRGGLVAALLLGGGRAVGEAIAVTQVIGITTHGITVDLFRTGDTLGSRIASQFPGASSRLQISSLFYLGVILLLMSLVTNFVAQVIVRRYEIERR